MSQCAVDDKFMHVFRFFQLAFFSLVVAIEQNRLLLATFLFPRYDDLYRNHGRLGMVILFGVKVNIFQRPFDFGEMLFSNKSFHK